MLVFPLRKVTNVFGRSATTNQAIPGDRQGQIRVLAKTRQFRGVDLSIMKDLQVEACACLLADDQWELERVTQRKYVHEVSQSKKHVETCVELIFGMPTPAGTQRITIVTLPCGQGLADGLRLEPHPFRRE